LTVCYKNHPRAQNTQESGRQKIFDKYDFEHGRAKGVWVILSAAITTGFVGACCLEHLAQRGRFEFSGSSCLQLACMAAILRRLSAMQTSLNSACAFFNPRMLNCLNPNGTYFGFHAWPCF
jgi:hypothetical protein